MAVARPFFGMPKYAVIETILGKYGIDGVLPTQCTVTVDDNHRLVTIIVPARRPPMAIQNVVRRLRARLTDDFRGPVLKAASPDLHSDLEQLLAAYHRAYEATRIQVSFAEAMEAADNLRFTGVPKKWL